MCLIYPTNLSKPTWEARNPDVQTIVKPEAASLDPTNTCTTAEKSNGHKSSPAS